MGQLTLAMTVVSTIGTVFAGGIELYLIAEIGRDRRHTERLLSGLWGLRLVLLPLMALAALLVLHVTRVTATTFYLGELMGLSMPLAYLVMMPFRSMFAGWEEARRVSLIDLAGALSAPLAIPFLAYGPKVLPLADLVAGVLLAGSLLSYARTRVRLWPTFDFR